MADYIKAYFDVCDYSYEAWKSYTNTYLTQAKTFLETLRK